MWKKFKKKNINVYMIIWRRRKLLHKLPSLMCSQNTIWYRVCFLPTCRRDIAILYQNQCYSSRLTRPTFNRVWCEKRVCSHCGASNAFIMFNRATSSCFYFEIATQLKLDTDYQTVFTSSSLLRSVCRGKLWTLGKLLQAWNI